MECDWWSLGVILYECLVGYTPFYADEPVITCKKILRWRETLEVPNETINALTPECLDFMLSLICNSEKRLGKNGVEELKTHNWFKDIDWNNIRQMPAPLLPAGSAEMKVLIEELKVTDTQSSR